MEKERRRERKGWGWEEGEEGRNGTQRLRLVLSDVNTSLRPTSFCLKSASKESLSYKAIHAIGRKLSLSGSLSGRSPAAAGGELTRAQQPLKPGLPTPPL